MKILVLSVGRPERAAFGPIFDGYAGRVRKLGVEFEAKCVPEVRAGGRFSDAHVREREGRSIAAAVPERSFTIVLTPEGAMLDSGAFAKRLETWARRSACFVVGGPLGLDPALVDRADARLSLTPMTLPHELARVVLAEQIYRAVTILKRIPYHK